MPALPETNGNNVVAPHTVILGAGASIAMTRLNKEKFGKTLPSMDNLVETVGLEKLLEDEFETKQDRVFITFPYVLVLNYYT